MKHSNDTIGNRTHHLPAYSAVPQQGLVAERVLQGSVKGTAIPVQVWTGPEGSRRLRSQI